jgi:outer membrane protein
MHTQQQILIERRAPMPGFVGFAVHSFALAGIALAFFGIGYPAAALTLTEALAFAYENSDRLSAARDGQKATDEALPQAKANWFRPTITLSGEEGRTYLKEREAQRGINSSINLDAKETTDTTVRQAGYNVTLPLWRGGQTQAAISAAEAEIGGGQAGLLGTEQDVLGSVVSAYADVVYYHALVAIGEAQVKELGRQADLTRELQQAQRATVTDLGYARDALAQARASLATNRGGLRAAGATFEATVGIPATALDAAPALASLPESEEAAVSTAIIDNPDLRTAVRAIDQYTATVRRYEGALLPEINLYHSFTREWDKSKYAGSSLLTGSATPYDTVAREDTFKVGVELSMTLYQGGANHSAVREAKATLSEARRTLAFTRATVEGNVKAGWEHLLAAHEALAAYEDSLRELAGVVDGYRRLYQRGDRTISDLIDVIERRNAAQASIAGARRNVLLAEAQLLRDMGRLTASGQQLPVMIYDPQLHASEVGNKWIGLGD